MGFFNTKKKDGPGKIRITYCGYIKGSNGTVTEGWGSQILQSANSGAEAKQFLAKFVKNGYITDASKKPLSSSNGYEIGSYLYNESKTQPGNFYHDFRLVNEENDHFCSSGGRKRRTRKYRGKKSRSKKSRKTCKNRKY